MIAKIITEKKGRKRVKLLIGLVTILLIVLMFPHGESIESEVTIGSIWIQDDLIAPFSFPVFKDPIKYKKELISAEKRIYPVFQKSITPAYPGIDSLKKFNDYILKLIDTQLSLSHPESENPTFLSSRSFDFLKNLRLQERNLLFNNKASIKDIFNTTAFVLNEIYKKGIIEQTELKWKRDSIAIRTGNIDRIDRTDKFLSVESAHNLFVSVVQKLNISDEQKNIVTEYGSHFLLPNILFNESLTDELIEQTQKTVSRYAGIVNENERIVAKHDRISEETKLKIDSYRNAKGERLGEEGFIFQMLGKFIHVSFIISLLLIYLYLFRKKIFYDNNKIFLISLIILFISFITYLINQIYISAPIQLLIFIPAASMLLTIIFDSRVGFYSTVVIALIAGALRGNDYSFALTNLFAGALAVYTVRDIKNRSQIFRSFLYILIGYIVALSAFALERFASMQSIIIEFAFAGSNALISPVLTYGLLIFFERFFNITTDLTLLELSNFDRPLLKELANKTPGTFNHSLSMGTLAEAASERINANALLARVGAYYHDVGKTFSPQNFVENQSGRSNIHENLTPEESVKLLINHVNNGIELAKQNNLPAEIINFIPMHHGTSVMTFFFEKAKKLYGEEKVLDKNYRYPGPKPNTKETAIVMLADGCESAVRSIEDPNADKVENVIESVINNRIREGQLDDSPITFSDIAKIKETFINILIGNYHKRIRYPKQDEIEKGSEEEKHSE
ncbi:MAG TPA: HDIG domain-containing protein [Ignavibacteriaceae bacterium]|nr:HDIG domain-containing protein [Ignavibacteriaceae bacterium]